MADNNISPLNYIVYHLAQVEDVGSIMGSTRATLTGWQHKIVKNKIYMYAAAVFLFLVNVALICIMYEHHGNIVFR